MRAALYARVSKAGDQTPENQIIALKKWAANSGAEQAVIYVDELSSRDTRPKKEEVLRLARTKQIDTIVFVSLDRWGRTLPELVQEMRELPEIGVTLISLKEGLNFGTAAGKMYANLLAVFADFERELIRERTVAGLTRARAQGKRLGRHPRNCDCPKHRNLTGSALQGGFLSVKSELEQTDV